MDYSFHYESPLGGITLASDGEGLTGLWFDGQKHFGATLPTECRVECLPIFCETAAWLNAYFRGEKPETIPVLHLRGTPFRSRVWEILKRIPYGQLMTYGEIAAILAAEDGIPRMSARAVGGAVGHNPVSIIIPCHRVTGANGSLTGYAGGLERKKELLRLEGIAAEQGQAPFTAYCCSLRREACSSPDNLKDCMWE